MARGSISSACGKSLQTHRRALYIAGTTFGNPATGVPPHLHGPHRQHMWATGLTLDHRHTLRMTPRSKSATPRAPLHFLGLACAIGVSTIYFNQPLLVEMGKTYGAPAGRVMYVASATQVGYALGLLLFVPLGDLLERRALMRRMYAAVIVALLLVSLAPTLAWLIAASVLLGVVASVTHIVLPIAPDLVPHKERGRAIGTVMMGLLLGVLLARTFAGWISHIPTLFVYAPRLFPSGAFWVTDGWRYVFIIAALGNAIVSSYARSRDAAPAAQAGHALRRRDALPLDARPHPAVVARIGPDQRARLRLLQLLLDHAGVSAQQPLRPRRGRCGQLRAGRRGGRAGRPGRGQAGGQARHAMGAHRRNDADRLLLSVAVGRRGLQPPVRAAHRRTGGRSHRAGRRHANGAGGQSDAHLRPGSFGAQPA